MPTLRPPSKTIRRASTVLTALLNALRRRRLTVLIVFVVLWVLVDTDSTFLWFLRWTFLHRPAPPDRLLTHNCPGRNYSLPLVVVVPLIASQVSRLEWTVLRWARADLPPCHRDASSTSRPPSLAIFFDRPLSEPNTVAAVASVNQLFARQGVARVLSSCFDKVQISSANLTDRVSKNGGGFDIVRSLVASRGSNKQLEKAFITFGGGQFRHMWYMEPDTWPIRPGWLDAVEEESRWGDFWVRGSVMRYAPRFHIGWEPFRTSYLRHINGNALYALGDVCFDRFRYLVDQQYGDGAYDVARAFYLLDVGHIMTFQAVAHRFQVSRVVADMGVIEVDEESLLKQLAGTYLVHAKHPFRKHRAFPLR